MPCWKISSIERVAVIVVHLADIKKNMAPLS